MSMSVTGRRTGIWVSRRRCRGQEQIFSLLKLRYMFGYMSQLSAADPTPTDYLNYFIDCSLTTRSFLIHDTPTRGIEAEGSSHDEIE